MDTVVCPHCSAANQICASFCSSCGKALPSPDAGGPTLVVDSASASTAAGVALQSDVLAKEAKKAAGALLAVAILQIIFGTVILFVLRSGERLEGFKFQLRPALYLSVYGIGVLFFCLYLWARRNPLPAAIAGLALFATVHLLDAIADPLSLARGIIVKIIIIAVLIRAIKAGVRHRELQKQAQSG